MGDDLEMQVAVRQTAVAMGLCSPDPGVRVLSYPCDGCRRSPCSGDRCPERAAWRWSGGPWPVDVPVGGQVPLLRAV